MNSITVLEQIESFLGAVETLSKAISPEADVRCRCLFLDSAENDIEAGFKLLNPEAKKIPSFMPTTGDQLLTQLEYFFNSAFNGNMPTIAEAFGELLDIRDEDLHFQTATYSDGDSDSLAIAQIRPTGILLVDLYFQFD